METPTAECGRASSPGGVPSAEYGERGITCGGCDHQANLDKKMFEHNAIIKHYLDELSKTESIKAQYFNDKLRENRNTFKTMIANIRKQGEVMKRGIDTITDSLVKLCIDLEGSNAHILETSKSFQETLNENNKSRKELCQKVLSSGTNSEVVQLAKECQVNSPVTVDPPNLKVVDFCPREVATSHLNHMMGSLTVDGLDHVFQCQDDQCAIVSEFQHVTTASTIRAIEEEEACLSHWRDEHVYRVNRQGQIKVKVACGVKIRNMAVSPDTGRVWFCCWEDGTVREIIDDTVETRLVSDHAPMSLCVTGDRTVVVGAAGHIRLYTTEGQEVTSGDRPCKQAAVTPHHVTCCPQSGDVAAADNGGVVYDDYISGPPRLDTQPHVKVMDKYLALKFRYPHVRDHEITHRLLRYPYDVCFDGRGGLLVADWATNSVLLIDGGRGHFIRTIYTGDAAPHTISRQGTGVVWIGFVGQTVRVLKYRTDERRPKQEEHEEGTYE